MNRSAGVKAGAMARTQEAGMLAAQIVGGLFNLRCNLQQVESADDPPQSGRRRTRPLHIR